MKWLILLVLVSCITTQPSPKKYVILSNNTATYCAEMSTSSCGVDLWDCSNGNEYYCATNIIGLK